jgi:hypothetical protein
MPENVLGKDIGNPASLFPPIEDGMVEVVFVEVAGEDIGRFILLQEGLNVTVKVQPVIEDEDGLLRFQYETAMENVRQRHGYVHLSSVPGMISDEI